MRHLKKILIGLTAFLMVSISALLILVFNPTLLYAEKTDLGQHVIFHDGSVPVTFADAVKQGLEIVKASELYDPEYNLEFCLNDGSYYPNLIGNFLGPAFAYGFSNKVVIAAQVIPQENCLELFDKRWDLTQLLAHEMMHCYQYNAYGLWGSNPIADHPLWKWEGYAEYIARGKLSTSEYLADLDHLTAVESKANDGWISQGDFVVPINYFRDRLLVHYAMEIKGLTYHELLEDRTSEEDFWEELSVWHQAQ